MSRDISNDNLVCVIWNSVYFLSTHNLTSLNSWSLSLSLSPLSPLSILSLSSLNQSYLSTRPRSRLILSSLNLDRYSLFAQSQSRSILSLPSISIDPLSVLSIDLLFLYFRRNPNSKFNLFISLDRSMMISLMSLSLLSGKATLMIVGDIESLIFSLATILSNSENQFTVDFFSISIFLVILTYKFSLCVDLFFDKKYTCN